MQGFKCNVTGATSAAPLAKAQAPVMCVDDPSKCVVGAKQMIPCNREILNPHLKVVGADMLNRT